MIGIMRIYADCRNGLAIFIEKIVKFTFFTDKELKYFHKILFDKSVIKQFAVGGEFDSIGRFGESV